MLVSFRLSMPGVGSWNGRWTGEGQLFCKVMSLPRDKAAPLVDRSFDYVFGVGWRASVSVRQVDAKEARKLRKATRGFCGYEWMIASILKHGRIQTSFHLDAGAGDNAGRGGLSLI